MSRHHGYIPDEADAIAAGWGREAAKTNGEMQLTC